jgi:hypothetical protein
VDERLIAGVRLIDVHELFKIGEECGGVHSRHGLEWRDPRGWSRAEWQRIGLGYRFPEIAKRGEDELTL